MNDLTARLDQIMDDQQAGLMCVDGDGVIEYCNQAGRRIFGEDLSFCPAPSFWTLSEQFSRDKILEALRSDGVSHRFFIPRSEEKLYQAYFTVRESSGAAPSGFVAFILPVMGEISELLEGSSSSEKLEAIGKVTAKLGHDFNNLLGAVRGCVDLIKHKLTRTSSLPPYERQIQIIESSLRKAVALTSAMRGFVRPGPLQTTRTTLSGCVRSVIDLLQEAHAVSVDIDFEVSADPLVDIGEFQVAQVLMALCLNAAEAMRDFDDRFLMIRLEEINVAPGQLAGLLPQGRYAHLGIIDHGVGMSSEVKARAFQPFFTTKAQEIGKGMGLGLAMAHEVMRKLRGEITIDSIAGCGTAVHLYFPAAEK
jgi:signal transduction histidine kinase